MSLSSQRSMKIVTLNLFQGLKRCRNKFGMTFSGQ